MNSAQSQGSNNGGDQWFENGTKAMSRRDWNYGVECLTTAVRLQPDELEYRIQKHRCCRRKHKKNGGVSRLESVKLAAIRSRLLTAQVRDDWGSIDQLAEDAIAIDPTDAQMFAHIAGAATKTGRYELAKYAWRSAVRIDRKNAAYFRAFGGLLQANGEYEEARACFVKIRGIDPTGRIAEELISAVDIAALMERRGFSEAQNARDVTIDREPQLPEERQSANVPEVVDPASLPTGEAKLAAFVNLAEQHVQQGELATAVEAFQHALELAPYNRSIRNRMDDVELAFLRGRAMDAQNGAKKHPDSERRRAIATQLLTELTSRELQILSRRVEESPNDLLQTFRLADLYRRASQLEQAIPLFQKVCADEQLQAEAMTGLGECWIKSNRAEQGRQQLETALQTIDRKAKPNAFKLAHYWLGRVHEARGDREQTLGHYSEILAIDYHFRGRCQPCGLTGQTTSQHRSRESRNILRRDEEWQKLPPAAREIGSFHNTLMNAVTASSEQNCRGDGYEVPTILPCYTVFPRRRRHWSRTMSRQPSNLTASVDAVSCCSAIKRPQPNALLPGDTNSSSVVRQHAAPSSAAV